jgi:hypothetical protein
VARYVYDATLLERKLLPNLFAEVRAIARAGALS